MNKTRSFFILLLIMIVFQASSPTVCLADLANELMAKQQSKDAEFTVQEVITSDLIVIENYLKKGENIRLAGIKASALEAKKKPTAERDAYGFPIEEEASPDIPVEKRALDFVKGLVEGKKIRIEYDRVQKNDKLETIAYVFLVEDHVFVNTEILRQGYATLSVLPLNKKYLDELQKAYQEARREKRGIHSQ